MTLQAKIIASLVATLLLSILCVLGTQQVAAWRKGYLQAQQQVPVMQNTSDAIKEGVELDEFSAGYNAGLQQGRTTFQQSKDEAKRNEPETAKRAGTVVPDSVRNAFRQRRIARERLGCAGSECEKDNDTDAATQR